MQIYTVIAAFGGLLLGVINLFLTLYKDFWRKSKLEAVVETAVVRDAGQGWYDFQVNLILTAKVKPTYIKELGLNASVGFMGDFMKEKKTIMFYSAIPFARENLLDEYDEDFSSALKERYEATKINIRDLRVESQTSLTLVECIQVTREPDGYADFPLRGWKLHIEHTDGTLKVPFDFQNHGKDKYSGNFSRR